MWKPWVTVIPFERYYLWEGLFLVPLSFQLWVTFAGVAHLLAATRSLVTAGVAAALSYVPSGLLLIR